MSFISFNSNENNVTVTIHSINEEIRDECYNKAKTFCEEIEKIILSSQQHQS